MENEPETQPPSKTDLILFVKKVTDAQKMAKPCFHFQ